MHSKLEKKINGNEYFEIYGVKNGIYDFKVAVNSVSLFTPIKMYVNIDKLKG